MGQFLQVRAASQQENLGMPLLSALPLHTYALPVQHRGCVDGLGSLSGAGVETNKRLPRLGDQQEVDVADRVRPVPCRPVRALRLQPSPSLPCCCALAPIS
jgi:hypothetical protein